MKQSRHDSILESLTNIAVGLAIQYTAAFYILHALGYSISHKDNLYMGLIMTVISMARSYILRRVFNKLRLFGYATREVQASEEAVK